MITSFSFRNIDKSAKISLRFTVAIPIERDGYLWHRQV